MSDEPRQLKLTPKEKKEEKANKWIVVVILLLTVVISLIFLFSSRKNQPVEPRSGLFGPKVYQF